MSAADASADAVASQSVTATEGASGDAAAASRSVYATIKNAANSALTLKSAELLHGIWTENSYPPKEIDKGTWQKPTIATFATESQGFGTGVEGTVVYYFGDGKTTLALYFDNPYFGNNKYDCKIDGPEKGSYTCKHSGGSGDNANVTFDIGDNSQD